MYYVKCYHPAMIHPTTDIAYLAAIIDGEGCINISSRMAKGGIRPSFRLELIIANNYRPMLAHLRVLWGGSIHETRRGHYQLRFGARDTAQALKLCLPYFLVKGIQAKIALDFYRTFDAPLTDEVVSIRAELKKALMSRPLG